MPLFRTRKGRGPVTAALSVSLLPQSKACRSAIAPDGLAAVIRSWSVACDTHTSPHSRTIATGLSRVSLFRIWRSKEDIGVSPGLIRFGVR